MSQTNTIKVTTGKELYNYQKIAIEEIFQKFDSAVDDYHLLYQLQTGGGKTVIFSEIVRRYISKFKKKVLVLTHRIELSKQTSNMLNEFGVPNKVINKQAPWSLGICSDHECFTYEEALEKLWLRS